MAVLDETNRWRVWAQSMRESVFGTLAGITKADLRAALNATDDWIDANQSSFNAALPLPFRTAATAQQKTLLFVWVAMRRAGLHKAAEDG